VGSDQKTNFDAGDNDDIEMDEDDFRVDISRRFFFLIFQPRDISCKTHKSMFLSFSLKKRVLITWDYSLFSVVSPL